MDRLAGAALRWMRALLVALVALGGGVVAHAGAHGHLPGRAALVTLLALCSIGAAAFLGRPASTRRVVLLLMGGQTFIHAGLTALAGHRGDPVARAASATSIQAPAFPSGTGRRVGSLYDQVAATHPVAGSVDVTVPYWLQHLVEDMTGPHAVMAVVHLAAAALVGVWLASGERALWTLICLAGQPVVIAFDRLVAGGVVLLAATATSGIGCATVLAEAASLPKPRWVHPEGVTRRGPPPLLAA